MTLEGPLLLLAVSCACLESSRRESLRSRTCLLGIKRWVLYYDE
jgi:hypothetical protein